VATTSGIDSGDIRDLMVESVERRFRPVSRLPAPVEWLSDNGSPYTARYRARDPRAGDNAVADACADTCGHLRRAIG
jgi:putative transposase